LLHNIQTNQPASQLINSTTTYHKINLKHCNTKIIKKVGMLISFIFSASLTTNQKCIHSFICWVF